MQRRCVNQIASCMLLTMAVAGKCAALERETVAFAINHNTVFGQSVYVLGDIPELGGNNAAYAIKLEPGSYPLWQAAVAVPAGTDFTYRYIWRNDSVPQWSNSANSNAIGGVISDSTTDGDPLPNRKGVYYHSGWSAPVLHWRIGGGTFIDTPMTVFGPGRSESEARWRALGIGQAEREIEFHFSDGGAGRDPAVGEYRTLLDSLFVQDGHVLDYAPTETLSNPVQVNVGTFFSTILGENRPYRVLRPRGYTQNTDKYYPVLYMQDGQNVFDLGPFGTWNADETAGSMIRGGQMREIIIVAVDNTANRGRNYVTPDDIVPIGPGTGSPGQANLYASFLINELKPVIDAAYRTRTDRDNTAAIGSSLGGVVSLYLGWDFNATFGRCAAMSGSWQLQNFPNRVASEPYRDLRVYLDSGDCCASSYDNAWGSMNLRDNLLRKNYVLESDLRHVVGYGHQHNEAAWAARLPRAYEFLFPATESENPLKEEMFTGDLDHDADMDADDLALLIDCLGGPNTPAPPGCTDAVAADLNGDGSRDLFDFAVFQRYHSGAR